MSDPTHIYCNNHAAPIIAEDHIRIKYHHIRDLIACKDTSVTRARSSENVVDIMTKLLARNLGIKD
jgi:hypothetical protein